MTIPLSPSSGHFVTTGVPPYGEGMRLGQKKGPFGHKGIKGEGERVKEERGREREREREGKREGGMPDAENSSLKSDR